MLGTFIAEMLLCFMWDICKCDHLLLQLPMLVRFVAWDHLGAYLNYCHHRLLQHILLYLGRAVKFSPCTVDVSASVKLSTVKLFAYTLFQRFTADQCCMCWIHRTLSWTRYQH